MSPKVETYVKSIEDAQQLRADIEECQGLMQRCKWRLGDLGMAIPDSVAAAVDAVTSNCSPASLSELVKALRYLDREIATIHEGFVEAVSKCAAHLQARIGTVFEKIEAYAKEKK